jgi:hypothetical protein
MGLGCFRLLAATQFTFAPRVELSSRRIEICQLFYGGLCFTMGSLIRGCHRGQAAVLLQLYRFHTPFLFVV